jgi:CTP:molybdopterin cytidylyltransferase MocA
VIVGLLLAAGGARRYGSQKLVARVGATPIVRHAADALRSAVDELVVVVGSDAPLVRRAFAGLDARCVENSEWAGGLSTSLRAGISAVRAEADAVVIALGDQPGLDPSLVRAVVAKWRSSGAPIVAARYRGERGHPVLLGRAVFDEVRDVSGDVGARVLMDRDPARVAYVDVNEAAPRDVDVPTDIEAPNG